MSDDMVKRVARAMCEAQADLCHLDPDDRDQKWGYEAAMHIHNARAAIAAMREPTPEMMKAANRAFAAADIAARAIWPAMIDAALTKGGGNE